MTTANELRAGLMALAKRSVSIMAACANEESTKLHLVLPFVSLLGYDAANPLEVYPGHRVPTVKPEFAPRRFRHPPPGRACHCHRLRTRVHRHR